PSDPCVEVARFPGFAVGRLGRRRQARLGTFCLCRYGFDRRCHCRTIVELSVARGILCTGAALENDRSPGHHREFIVPIRSPMKSVSTSSFLGTLGALRGSFSLT